MRRPPRPSQRMPFAEARQLVTHPVPVSTAMTQRAWSYG